MFHLNFLRRFSFIPFDRPVHLLWTVQFHYFRSTLALGRQILKRQSTWRTVHFHPFNPLDRPVFALWIVNLHFLRPSSFIPGPSTFIPRDRSGSFLPIVNSLFPLDRPLLDFRTVHFQSSGPCSLTPTDRPLWLKTVHFRLDPQNNVVLSSLSNNLGDFYQTKDVSKNFPDVSRNFPDVSKNFQDVS